MFFSSVSIQLATGWLLVAVTMAGLWALHLRLDNGALADVGWSYSVAGLALFDAATSDGWPVRRLTVALLVTIWGVRLGTHLLADRVLGHTEDGRYAALRRDYGEGYRRRFFWFFQAQAAAAVLFSLPALLASRNSLPGWRWTELAAVLLWTAAFLGEVTADRQLSRFKATHRNEKRPCAVGLWRYSRHPNYFFEWLIWIALALFALGSPYGGVALVCPVAMLYLLFRVTGIPLAEAQALRTRGDPYRRYQQTTSVFVPWVPSA